ncbi:MAG: exodeoxyribonuclease VII large subunit [Streptococcaceae bacterium]|jgi:exodeoxyribonuclease VII large subunit|nr:exodeoxyribonuclease VII large subunit [Streptococcaceae bacterium]
MEKPQYLSVTSLTKYIKAKFDRDPYLEKVYLTGEVSNYRKRVKHQYFSLKDERSVINAMMWEKDFARVNFELEEGMKVLVIGRVSVYEPSGTYQMVIEHIEPDGIGALYQKLRQLQEKLGKEGLFDERFKQIIPKFPKRIAVITSPSGAVIRDILTTVKRRYPIAEVVLFPTLVQGNEAARSIAENIQAADQLGSFDTMIVGRGGGSIEDLWSFNEEIVVRAIFEAKTPIVSSVGHETDVTLADFAADIRAATPTAAAEIATPVLSDELAHLQNQQRRLYQALQKRLELKKMRFDHAQKSYVFTQPSRLYEGIAQKLDKLTEKLYYYSPLTTIEIMQEKTNNKQKRLVELMNNQLDLTKEKTQTTIISLDLLSPLKVLARGFNFTTKNDKIIKTIEQVEVGDEIEIHLTNGQIKANITEVVANAKNEDI